MSGYSMSTASGALEWHRPPPILLKKRITIVQTEIFDEGASDMSTQLLKLKTGSFHDIVLVSTQPEAGRVLKQAGELNLGKQWYSDSYTVEGQMVLDTAGAAADG